MIKGLISLILFITIANTNGVNIGSVVSGRDTNINSTVTNNDNRSNTNLSNSFNTTTTYNSNIFDNRIKQLSKKREVFKMKSDKDTIGFAIDNSKKINRLNILQKQKLEKCIEYGGGITFFKINLKLYKKSCNEVFGE